MGESYLTGDGSFDSATTFTTGSTTSDITISSTSGDSDLFYSDAEGKLFTAPLTTMEIALVKDLPSRSEYLVFDHPIDKIIWEKEDLSKETLFLIETFEKTKKVITIDDLLEITNIILDYNELE